MNHAATLNVHSLSRREVKKNEAKMDNACKRGSVPLPAERVRGRDGGCAVR